MTKSEKTPEEKSLRVMRVLVENYKRIELAELRPTGRLTKLIGGNGHGKTSFGEAPLKAIAGKRGRTGVNLRQGAEEGRIEVDLGTGEKEVELSVELILKPNGEEYLEVRNADGVPMKGPQGLLDALIGPQRSQFDPLAFLRLSPKEQAEKVRIALGLDFTDIDKEHAEKFAERTVLNREVERSKARLTALPRQAEDAPDTVDLQALLTEQDRLQSVQRANDLLASDVREATTKREGAVREYKTTANQLVSNEADLEAAAATVTRLTQQIANGKARLVALEEQGKKLAEDLKQAEQKASEAEDVTLALADARAKLEEANTANEANALAAAKKKEREEVAATLKKTEAEAGALTKRLGELDGQKVSMIRGAAERFPVKGMNFNAHGLTMNELPFEQASQAEQVRVAVALGIADKPRFRTMHIKEGSYLDNKSMALLEGILEEFDAYAFVEAVDPDGKGADGRGPCVVIALGRIAEVRTAEGP